MVAVVAMTFPVAFGNIAVWILMINSFIFSLFLSPTLLLLLLLLPRTRLSACVCVCVCVCVSWNVPERVER